MGEIMSILSAKYFHDEQAAYRFIESRVWANGRICPHCGCVDSSAKLGGKSTRMGVYKCYDCYKPFTVKVGTIFEGSHIKLNIWLQAMYLMCSSKKGISSTQLHRTLGITLKSAWFLSHRIREAMKPLTDSPVGGGGKIIEIDETFVGGKEKHKHASKRHKARSPFLGKQVVLSYVEREGKVRSHHIEKATKQFIAPVLKKNIKEDSLVFTDEASQYAQIGKEFIAHHAVNHSKGEYSLGGYIHTNTIEGYFSVFKRGMTGTYQHCKPKHLKRYLAEFDFRYNHREALGIMDTERTEELLKSVSGKRLKYKH